MDLISRYDSPLGEIVLAADGDALIGLWFAGQAHFGAGLQRPEEGDCAVLREARAWLDTYFAGKAPAALPKISPRGTAFQQRVWQALLQIPRGETVTYGALAAKLGSHARAVGGAVGRNPISILIPCHRVVGADGSLTGYAGGTERKRRLLELEGAEKQIRQTRPD